MDGRKLATCPVCNGQRKDANTGRPCRNCGGQRMFGEALGVVPLDKNGNPCRHEYKSFTIGRCLTRYTCVKCGYEYVIDSGD